MKMTKIALAIAGLVGSTAAFAVPVTIADIEAARTNNNLQQAWISGASAPTKSIYEGFVGPTGGCDPTTNAIFTSQSTTSTSTVPGSLGNFTAYACTRNGVVSVLYHTVDGGSLNAYTPFTNTVKLARLAYLGTNATCAAPLNYVDTTNANNNAAVYKACTLAGAAISFTAANPNNGVQNLTGVGSVATNGAAILADSLAPQLPVGGFSDVEARLFPTTIGGGNVGSFGSEGATGLAQVFGVVTSVPAYRAMQAAQGIPAATIAADTTFDPAFAPSISSAQYASLASQGGSYLSATGWTSIVGAASGAGKRMIVQRRVQTSGSQASSNAFFLKNPCSSGFGGALNPAAAVNNINFGVIENPSSGNVKTQITAATNASNVANSFAIGVLSLENDWRLETDPTLTGYRFIKVDGVHPEAGGDSNARLSAASGDYRFVMELVSFVRNDNAGVKTPFEAGIVGQIATALASPVAASCSTLPRGLALLPKATNTCTVGTQVLKGTVNANNCAPQRLSF